MSFYKADITQQDVVRIDFDANGIVSDVHTHGLELAQAIEPDPNQTRTLGNELTLRSSSSWAISGGSTPTPEQTIVRQRRARQRQRRSLGAPGWPDPYRARRSSLAAQCAAMAARLARISSATMLVILIIGLIAGPAVSL